MRDRCCLPKAHTGSVAHAPNAPLRALTLLLAGLVVNLGQIHVRDGLQGRVVVEEVGDEGEVQFVVAVDDLAWGQELTAADLLRLLQHPLGALRQVRLLWK